MFPAVLPEAERLKIFEEESNTQKSEWIIRREKNSFLHKFRRRKGLIDFNLQYHRIYQVFK